MALIESDAAIDALLRSARTIAVVGLSDRPDRDSYHVSSYMQQQGYEIIPVNPIVSTVLGQRSFPDLDTLDRPVDIVDVFRRPAYVPDIVDAAIRIGAKCVWLQLGIIHEDAASRAVAAGLDVVMDRCLLIEHRRLLRSY